MKMRRLPLLNETPHTTSFCVFYFIVNQILYNFAILFFRLYHIQNIDMRQFGELKVRWKEDVVDIKVITRSYEEWVVILEHNAYRKKQYILDKNEAKKEKKEVMKQEYGSKWTVLME